MLVLVLQMGGECGHGSEEDEVSELHEHHYEAVYIQDMLIFFLISPLSITERSVKIEYGYTVLP